MGDAEEPFEVSAELVGLSAAAVAPAIAGMLLGQRLRRSLSEALFRRLFFAAVGIVGIAIAARSLIAYGAA